MQMRPSKALSFSLVLSAGVALATLADAQQAGTYVGQTSDGHAVHVTVGVDPANGDFEVTSVDWDYSILCAKSLEVLDGGIGFGFGDGADILNGKFASEFHGQSGYLTTSMTFKGTDFVKGRLGDIFPRFDPAVGYTAPPKKTQTCASSEPFTANFSGGAPGRPIPANTLRLRDANTETSTRILKR
jgi:hypothetical protein